MKNAPARHVSRRRPFWGLAAALLVLLGGLGIAGSLHAAAPATGFWDRDDGTIGATTGTTAPGTWDTTTKNWNFGNTGGSGANSKWTAGSIARFSAGTDASGTFTVTVSGTQDTAGLYFEEGTVTLSGGNLNFSAADSFIRVDSGLTATVASVMQGTNGIEKTGTGLLILTGANTFTGGLDITAGTVRFTNSSGSSSLAANTLISVASGATVDFAASNPTPTGSTAVDIALNGGTYLFSGGTSNTGTHVRNLSFTDGGSMTSDTGVGSFAGFNVALNGNVSMTGAGNASISLEDGLGLLSDSTWDIASTGTLTVSTKVLDYGGTRALTKTGTGTLTLASDNTYTGTTTVSSGKLVLQGQTTSATITTAAGATTELNVASGTRDNGTNTTFSGSGTLAKTGAGTSSWGTTVATYALGSGGLIDVREGTFDAGSNLGASAEVWTDNLADLNVASGATFYGGGTAVRVDAISGAGTIQWGWDANTSFTFGVDNGTGDFSGVISTLGSGSTYNKVGTGTQTFSGTAANTYTGTTTVKDGTLALNKTAGVDATGTGALTIGDGTGSANTAIVKLLANNQINDASAVTLNTDGKFDLNGKTETVASIAGSGNITLAAGSLTAGGSNASTTFSGVMSGTGTFTKTGTGTTTFSGNNTYTGTTTVSTGKLVLQGQTASGTINTASGATTELNVASGTRDNTTNTTFTGTGTLTKTGTGTMQWGNSVATYALGSGGLIDIQAGLFDAGWGTGGSVENWTNNLADLNVATGATLRGGATAMRVDAITGGGTINWSWDANTSLTFGVDNGTGDFSGILGNYGATGAAMIKTGTGTQTFSGTAANTYTGNTTVNDGTLALNKTAGLDATGTGTLTIGDGTGSANTAIVKLLANNQINNAVAVTLNTDGKFDLNGQTETVGSIAGSGNITLGAGALTAGGDNSSTTFSGSMSGTGSFTKTGTGTTIFSGANSYTGGTTINGGTLALTGNNATNRLANNSLVTVNTGGTLDVRNTNPTATGANAIDVALTGGTYQLSGATNLGAHIRNLSFTDGGKLTDDGTVSSFTGTNSIQSNIVLNGTVSMTGSGTADITLKNALDLGSAARTWDIGTGGTLNTNATLTASGSFTKTGGGTLALTGTASNVMTGAFTVNDGTVSLNKTAGLDATGSGALTIGDGTGAADTAVVKLEANNQIKDTIAVTIKSDGQLNVNGKTETVGSVAGAGKIALGAGKLTAGGDNTSTTFSGSMSGTGEFAKTGTGTLTLASDIAYDGTFTLNGGTLKLDNADLSVGTITITANSTIDFGTTGNSELFAGTLSFLNSDITLNILNWTKGIDAFYAEFWNGATYDLANNANTAPMNQIVFDGFTSDQTGWDSYDDQIYPNVPEPSTYGAIFIGLSTAAFLYRRHRTKKRP